jgi:acetyl esterase/lipase
MTWLAMTQAERDALYNNSAAVADSAQILAEWDRVSADLRQNHPGFLTSRYGEKERQTWDIFRGSDPRKPCLIHVHGGYWQMRNKSTFSFVAEGVSAHGWSVALPGYTLAPENSVSGIVRELRGALDWLESHRREMGILGPLILSGWSAGGHLTAMLLDHSAITAGLAVSGIYELGPLRDTYLNEKLRLSDEEVTHCSPLRLSPTPKPLAITYGTKELEPLVRSSRDLHEMRSAHHLTGELIAVGGANHFTILNGFRKPQGLLTQAALRLAPTATPTG